MTPETGRLTMQAFRNPLHSLRRMVLAVLLCCSAHAGAAVVGELYTATVDRPVDTADPRAAAQTAAMAEVLVRVTGNRAALSAPELAGLLENPGSYISLFGFSSRTQARVDFVPERIDQALTAAGWPTWGAERPQSILWIAVTDQFGEEAILTSDDPPVDAMLGENMLQILASVRADVEEIARARGLPYVLPSFAAAADMQFFFDGVWEYAFDRLSDQSAVWGADAIVIGRVRESVIGTDVEWLVQSEPLGLRLSLPGTGIPEGVHWLADEYARLFAAGGGQRSLRLRVSGIQNFDSYARVLGYLESVTMLSSVDVASWNGSELILNVSSRGDATVLGRVFRLDNVLQERVLTLPGLPGPFSGSVASYPGTMLDLVVVPERAAPGGFDTRF